MPSALRTTRWIAVGGLMVCVLLLAGILPITATASGLLGTAESFAVLAGSTVTNTGPSTIAGNVGVSPGSAVTGFPPGIVTNGTIHVADEVAGQAQADVTTAYNSLAGRACDVDLTGQDLGGLTLTSGVYCLSSSAQLTGTLTLDSEGNPDAEFIFQIGSALTTASNSAVQLIGGTACNVYWQVGSSATIGTSTQFTGSVLALTSITFNTGANLVGRALARNGAVTLDTNNISAAMCVPAEVPPTATPEAPTATPITPVASTATPITPVVSTATPIIPGVSTATPIIPGAGTATPIVPGAGTATPINPGAGTATPIIPGAGTATPIIPGIGTATPIVPGAGTAAPGTQTPAIHATNTPRATATAVSGVTFPNTGSGGILDAQQQQSRSGSFLAFGVTIALLLAASIGLFVQRRHRQP